MFSYIDLVRVEIALDAEARFGVTISDEETDGWRTLGDVAHLVAGRTGVSATEAEVMDWAHTLMAEAYGVSTDLTPERNFPLGDVKRQLLETSGLAADNPHEPSPRDVMVAHAGRTEGP